MNIKQIYRLAIDLGMEADLRGEVAVNKYLERARQKYEKLDAEAKEEFDQDRLFNPYSDSRILLDHNRKAIKKIVAGIDIGGSEMLLADKLGGVDLVISYHPDGPALADLSSVMDLQSHVLALYGVPINIAESILKPRISEVSRSTSPINHERTIDMARLLKLDYMCTHTVADNLGARFLFDLVKKNEKRLEYVDDLLQLLKDIPEYKLAAKRKAGPVLFAGSPESHCGKIVVTEFTGGTSGSKDIYEKMSHYGIGTIIGMHMGEEHRKEAEKYHINVVIAGHMASDSLGMNLLLDELEQKGLEIITLSGLTRIRRFKK